MVVLLLMNILIVFYVEALRKNEQEKFRAEFNEQQYRLQMRSNLFIAIVIYSFLAFKANARNNKNAAASSLN